MPAADAAAPPPLDLPAKPNIVYILADDMGYGDLSCLNPESKIRTPHLDRLAAGGMIATDGHATSAVCTPSRYSILTGRYNWRSWLKAAVIDGYAHPLIEAERTTVASLLRDQGYRTGCVGKWHLGWHWGRPDDFQPDNSDHAHRIDYTQPISGGPCDVGFDHFFGIGGSLDMPPYVYVEDRHPTEPATAWTPGAGHFAPDQPPRPRADGSTPTLGPAGSTQNSWRPGPMAPDFDFQQALPTFTDRADRFIRDAAAAGEPFFLYFPLPAPHTPILPSEKNLGRSGLNDYGDFCLDVDDIVGRIDATLAELGLTENTLVIFTADNGCSPEANYPALAEQGHHPSHVFRGHKADIYEGGHRVPLLIRWPDAIPPGSRCDETLCLVDLLATCAEITGAELPDHAGEDSVSELDAWRGGRLDPVRREATVHHSLFGQFAIRRGRWKLELCPGSGGWSPPAPGEEPEGSPPFQLYDLDADIRERRNVVDDHPELVAELKTLLARYVDDGRSTPGAPQANHPADPWPGLEWK